MNTDRRRLLAGTSAAALLALAPIGALAETSIDPDAFVKLSEKLTGQPGLNANLASQYLSAFEANGERDALQALIAGGDNADLANDIVAAWYSGMVAGDAGDSLVTYGRPHLEHADLYQTARLLRWRNGLLVRPAGLMTTTLQTDVAVIGAGFAGALVAAKLAGDVDVTLIDAGPRIDRNAAVEKFWNAPIKVPEAPYPHSETYPHPVSNDLDGWYVQTGPDKFNATYLRAVGGTSWHWLGTALRLVPDDFRLHTKFGRGVDWPLTYDALESWYAKAETELGVAGDSKEDLGSPRTSDFPLPAIPTTYSDRQYVKALAGTPYAAVLPTPAARNSAQYQDRPACCGNGSCIPICPVQAKYDATVHVDRANKQGAKVLDSTVVVRLDTGDDGRISAAYVKHPDGSEAVVRAKAFVLAAHAIETPRLLLNSASETYPRGLATTVPIRSAAI